MPTNSNRNLFAEYAAAFATMKSDLREGVEETCHRFAAAILSFSTTNNSVNAISALQEEFLSCMNDFYFRFEEYLPRLQRLIDEHKARKAQ